MNMNRGPSICLFQAILAAFLYKMLTNNISGTPVPVLFCVSFSFAVVFAASLGRLLAEKDTVKRLMFARTTDELAGALPILRSKRFVDTP